MEIFHKYYFSRQMLQKLLVEGLVIWKLPQTFFLRIQRRANKTKSGQEHGVSIKNKNNLDFRKIYVSVVTAAIME